MENIFLYIVIGLIIALLIVGLIVGIYGVKIIVDEIKGEIRLSKTISRKH